jgi:hypothetical protein
MLGASTEMLNEAKQKNKNKIKVPSADELPTLAGKIKDLGNAFQSVSSNSGQNNNLMQLGHSAEDLSPKKSERTPVPSFGKMSDQDDKSSSVSNLTADHAFKMSN